MSLSSTVCMCLDFLSWWNVVIESMTRFHQDRNPRHTHTHTHTQPTIMTYGRIPYKNITNVHPWNWT